MEPLEINHEAQKRLNHAENQQRDVVAPSPESPAQTRDKCARHEGKEHETKDVVPVGHVASADGPRGKEMTEQPTDKEQHTDPKPAAAPYVGNGHRAWPCQWKSGRLTDRA